MPAIIQYLDEVVLATMLILAYDCAAAEWHAKERARLASFKTSATRVTLIFKTDPQLDHRHESN